MRVLQVVTYISPDGAYGGPVRVALNQVQALRDLGHKSTITGAAGGFTNSLPKRFNKLPVKLFAGYRISSKTGYAGMVAPRMLFWLPRALKEVDVVHVHLARDLVTLPAAIVALILKKPLIVQTHGMIDHSEKWLAKFLDEFLTRPVLRKATSVLCLTNKEQDDVEKVGRKGLRIQYLPNGVPLPNIQAIEQTSQPKENPEVLFLARLHDIKRPSFVVHAAKALRESHPTAKFVLVGPDDGEASMVKAIVEEAQLGAQVTIVGAVPPEQTISRMQTASIYVLPSKSESFGMSIAEAMSLALPVVVTETCALAGLVRERGAGIVCDLSQESFNDAVAKLLADPDLRRDMGANGRRAIQEIYSTRQVGNKLAAIYAQAAKRG